ncbi:MAG: thiamine diphosphokinase [Bacillota bacterium]|nr:thiamine diphosphokinase [Bacillota bacterium]
MRAGTTGNRVIRQEAARLQVVGATRRVLIIAGGRIADDSAARDTILGGDWEMVVCVDGGSSHAARLGVRPDVIIGDLDSTQEETVARLRHAGVTFVTHPVEKDKTDLDLALEYVVARGARDITAIGAVGDRLDHTLANVFLTIKAASLGASLLLTDGTSTVSLVQGEATITGELGDWVSLLPVGGSARGVYTEGLKYRLRGGKLRTGETLGMSNELTGPVGKVRVEAGHVILIHTPRRHYR